MSGVIKAARFTAEEPLRSFGAAVAALTSTQEPGQLVIDPRDAEIERLTADLAERDATIAAHAEELEAAKTLGEETGRAETEAQFEDERSAALEALEAGIHDAQAELTQALGNGEELGITVAREVLDKLFGASTNRSELIADLIRHRFAAIDLTQLLTVEVSRLDFPDTKELGELAQRIGWEPERITARIELPGGACRLILRLGNEEIGLDHQWGALRAMLETSETGDGDAPSAD